MRRIYSLALGSLFCIGANAQYLNIHTNGGNKIYSLSVSQVDSAVVGEEKYCSVIDSATFCQQHFLLSKNEIPSVDTTAAQIGSFSTQRIFTDGTLYPATVDNKCKDVNELFRYSTPVSVPSTYPKYFGVTQSTPRKLGIVIEFYADCTQFEIKAQEGFRCSIVVDGVKVNEKELVSSNGMGGFLYLPVTFKEKKKRHIRICFSGVFMGIISDGTISQYKKQRLLICSDGDSVVEGQAQVGVAEGIFGCWASCVAQTFDFDLYNTGVGGSGFVAVGNDHSTPNMVDRFDTYIGAYSPDVLIFSAGINDTYSEKFDENVEAYFKKATSLENCKVVALSPYCNVSTPSAELETKCSVLKAMALKYHVPFIDYMHCMTYDSYGNCITNNIGTDAYHNIITAENRSEFLNLDVDTTHPNKVGHLHIGEYIAHELYKVLNRLEGF